MQGWKVINRYRRLAGTFTNFTTGSTVLMWPLTPEYHGGQYRASTNQVWLQTDAGLESYSSFCKRHGRRTDGRMQFGSLSLPSTSVGSTMIISILHIFLVWKPSIIWKPRFMMSMIVLALVFHSVITTKRFPTGVHSSMMGTYMYMWWRFHFPLKVKVMSDHTLYMYVCEGLYALNQGWTL